MNSIHRTTQAYMGKYTPGSCKTKSYYINEYWWLFLFYAFIYIKISKNAYPIKIFSSFFSVTRKQDSATILAIKWNESGLLEFYILLYFYFIYFFLAFFVSTSRKKALDTNGKIYFIAILVNFPNFHT